MERSQPRDVLHGRPLDVRARPRLWNLWNGVVIRLQRANCRATGWRWGVRGLLIGAANITAFVDEAVSTQVHNEVQSAGTTFQYQSHNSQKR